MIDRLFLSYVPDVFGVQPSRFYIRNSSGEGRFVSASELAQISNEIVSFDIPALIDEYRRLKLDPPPSLVDVGEAIRLLIGIPKDEGGSKAWAIWPILQGYFESEHDGKLFQLIVQARAERPEPDRLDQLVRGAADALSSLWTVVESSLKNEEEWPRFSEIETRVQAACAYRQSRGIAVDQSEAKRLLQDVSAEKYRAFSKVASILGRSPTELNFWNIHPFLERTDVRHLQKIKEGGRLQDAFEIAAPTSEFAAAFLTLMKASRDERTLRRAIGASERLFPIFETQGTISGRILVSDPHLQYLRRPYRSVVQADRGRRLIYLDYAQYEPGILAGMAEDERLLAAYNAGDVYVALSEALFGSTDQRDQAKRVFLAFSYGMTPRRIAHLLAGGASDSHKGDEYVEAIKRFFGAFPRLQAFRNNQQSLLLKQGWVSSQLGNRRRRTRRGLLTYKERRWAVNQPIQATASLILKEALISVVDALGVDAFLLPVHDALLLQLSETSFEQDCEVASELMRTAFKRRFPAVEPRVTLGPFAS